MRSIEHAHEKRKPKCTDRVANLSIRSPMFRCFVSGVSHVPGSDPSARRRRCARTVCVVHRSS
ncbi:hypothetical protein BURMUCGD1_6217 [Burkholderia multivorans CGD1]|nr:hypothetical protein BURMUCGD1_6217 [Burkholderia multivorans CGD1]